MEKGSMSDMNRRVVLVIPRERIIEIVKEAMPTLTNFDIRQATYEFDSDAFLFNIIAKEFKVVADGESAPRITENEIR